MDQTDHTRETSKPETPPKAVRPHVVRAFLINSKGELAVIKRTKPNQPEYFVFPGGGVEGTDSSFQRALSRELLEELGARAIQGNEVFTITKDPIKDKESSQHFILCHLVSMNTAERTGDEFKIPGHGSYDIIFIDPRSEEFEKLELLPKTARDFFVTHAAQLVSEALAL